MAKIAVTSGSRPQARALASGDGWSVSEVVCTLGPRDAPFEERHDVTSIAIVVEGSFQYRSQRGHELMTPGSLMLINAGQSFECPHEHGTGDRCIAFSYSPEILDRIEAGPAFRALRIPPVRALSPLIAGASAALAGAANASWEELSIAFAARSMQLDLGVRRESRVGSPGASARVTRVVRAIERDLDGPYRLTTLAREARLSPYHFLRIFHQIMGVTPHQHLLRRRLERAAVRLRTEPAKIVDIALACGFGDVSNFNRAFRAEFGVSPRAWRKLGPSSPVRFPKRL